MLPDANNPLIIYFADNEAPLELRETHEELVSNELATNVYSGEILVAVPSTPDEMKLDHIYTDPAYDCRETRFAKEYGYRTVHSYNIEGLIFILAVDYGRLYLTMLINGVYVQGSVKRIG